VLSLLGGVLVLPLGILFALLLVFAVLALRLLLSLLLLGLLLLVACLVGRPLLLLVGQPIVDQIVQRHDRADDGREIDGEHHVVGFDGEGLDEVLDVDFVLEACTHPSDRNQSDLRRF